MPIWSLTRERIDKLLKQVGDKELEIDELIKLTKEDLWNKDLEEFITEWRFQLEDEAKRQKKVANMGRRASNKLKIAGGPAGRKRKANNSDDDSDFGGVVAKVKKQSAAPKQPKQPGGMLAYLNPDPPKSKKTSPKSKAPSATTKALMESFARPQKKEKAADLWMDLDSGTEDRKSTKAQVKAPAPTKKAPVSNQNVGSEDDDSLDEEIIRPTAGRKARAAATKPVKYKTLDSDSDGDDMLLDVGNMVKGIDTASATVNNSRPLFSTAMSRPGSSSGLPKKPTSSKISETLDNDDTNYSMLAPPPTGKGPALTAKKAILSEDDDDEEEEEEDSYQSFDDIAPAPKTSKPKPVTKIAPAKPPAKSKAPAKAPAAAAKKPTKAAVSKPSEPKKLALSPAAKAYAAKKAKLAAAAAKDSSEEDDEIEQVANEIMDVDDDDEDDDDEPPAAAAAAAVAVGGERRPARRAAATAPKKKWVISDDEEEDEDEDEDEGTTGVFEDDDTEF